MDAIKIGQHIAALRKDKGLTQQELAEQLNVTAKAVSKWETGHGLPDIQTIEPLAGALGVSIPEIMKGEAIPRETLPLPPAETLVDTAAYVEEQERLKRRSMILTGSGILLGALGIPCAIIGVLASGSSVVPGNLFRVIFTLPLAGALILLVTGGILLIKRYPLIRKGVKIVLLYIFYLCAVLVVFQMASVYNFGDNPTPMVLARLILYPIGLWGANLLLLWILRKKELI